MYGFKFCPHKRLGTSSSKLNLTYVAWPLFDATDERKENPMADWGIKLDWLRCHDAQEARDEPFIRVNGREVWRGAQVRTGETRELYFRALLDRNDVVQIR